MLRSRADDPDGQDEERSADGHGHVFRDEEDARADDAADDDADDVPETQDAGKRTGFSLMRLRLPFRWIWR